MDWDLSISVCLMVCLIIGVYLLSDNTGWTWSLKKRAYLRNGISDSIMNQRNWEKAMRNIYRIGPFKKLFQIINNYREQKMDREIFESITFLRNLASIDKEKAGSSDYIIEKLSDYDGLLQQIFIKMLNLLRVNQPQEAAELFSKSVGTSASKEFAELLLRWDQMDPCELNETLLSYEKSMKAIRLTEQKRKDEIISDLIYFPVVINILVIFVNFIYVAYFIDQKEMLQMFI